ncbi:MAG: hypothetical protein WAL30_05360 [Candidatus Aquirickettsiella sp.]
MPVSNANTLISALEKKIEAIESDNPQNNSALIHLFCEKYTYLYILKNQITEPLKPLITETLKKLFKLETYAGLQIIGDSAAFNAAATDFVQDKLENKLSQFNGLIYYGFTGEGANGVVADLLEKDLLSSAQVIANIVANDSLTVINTYKCRFSEPIRNFLIVGDGNGGCKFGDDIELSDQLAEQLICLEGGVISFAQLINTLIFHQQPEITIYSNLRPQDNSGFRPLFSAGELLLAFQAATHVTQMPNILEHYLENHRFNPGNNEENGSKKKQVHQYFEKFNELDASKQNKILKKIKNLTQVSFLHKDVNNNNGIGTSSLFIKKYPHSSAIDDSSKNPEMRL